MKFRAIVRFLSANEGGRKNPPQPTYRPAIKIDDQNYTSCFITAVDPIKSVFDFGIEHDVYLELMSENIYLSRLNTDKPIFLYEGSRLIGEGKFV